MVRLDKSPDSVFNKDKCSNSTRSHFEKLAVRPLIFKGSSLGENGVFDFIVSCGWNKEKTCFASMLPSNFSKLKKGVFMMKLSSRFLEYAEYKRNRRIEVLDVFVSMGSA